MKKRMMIIISLVLILCGCYDYRELNDMSIVTGIGIDYQDNLYVVSLEVTKSIKEGSSQKLETIIYTAEDEIIADAFLKAKNMSDKYVYTEHVNVLLVSKKLAENGVSKVIDYIVRETSINSNYNMIIVDNPKEIFERKLENDTISNLITNTVNYYLDNTSFDDLDIMASYMINKRDDIAVPYISMDEDKVIFDKVAYFDDDKYVGDIDSKLYTLLRLNSSNINFSKNGNTVSIFNNEIKYEVKKDEIIIKVSGEGLVKEINEQIDLEDDSSYSYLSRIISKDMKSDINNFLEKTLGNGSDLLGLQDKYFKKYKKDMRNIKYKVDVDLTITKNGTIYGVLYDK